VITDPDSIAEISHASHPDPKVVAQAPQRVLAVSPLTPCTPARGCIQNKVIITDPSIYGNGYPDAVTSTEYVTLSKYLSKSPQNRHFNSLFT